MPSTRRFYVCLFLCLTLEVITMTTVLPTTSQPVPVNTHSQGHNITNDHHHGNATNINEKEGGHIGNDVNHPSNGMKGNENKKSSHHDDGQQDGSHGNKTDHHGDWHQDGSHGNKTGHHDDGDHDGGHGPPSSIHLVEIHFEHVKGPLVFGLVVIIAGLSKIGFHHADFLSTKVPESCILILIGVVLGAIIHFSEIVKGMKFFQPHEFFLFLLPPIILEAAYSLHDRTFTENIGSILMFSVVGTIIACFMIGLCLIGLGNVGAWSNPGCTPVQILVFSALIVAVDPVAVLAIFQEVGVNKMLYFLVFGESLLNDGVTVVIYNVMQTYNRMDEIGADQIVLGILKFFVVVIGGLFVGSLCGVISSFLTKYTNSVKVVEPIIIFGFAYQSYILAEMFHFSGIISIIVCGLIQVQYAFNNITNKSKLCVKFFVKVISNTCEIIIFLFLGLKVVTPDHYWNTGFVIWTTLLCIVFRFLITYITSFMINRCDTYRVRKITMDEMFMISYGGLRGAVCFSLVALLDEKEFGVEMKNMFVTTTLFVIFFTVFVQGGTIKFLVKKLRVKLHRESKDMILYEELNQHISDHLMAGIEEIVGFSGKYYLMEKFDRVDDKFIRPVLLRDPSKCEFDEINNFYQKLIMKEHYKNLSLCGASNLPRVSSDLRQVDSSACLKVMGDEFETRQLDREEKIQDRRSRLISQRSLRSAESQDGGLDLHKLLHGALENTKNKNNMKFHDKNFIMDERRHLVGQLRSKHRKNQRLSTIQAEDGQRPLERALSWDENEGAAVERRTSDVKVNVLDRIRCHTMDLGTAMKPDYSHRDHQNPIFSLEDTVFEADEEIDKPQEEEPLINKSNGGVALESKPPTVNDDKQVTFAGLPNEGNPSNEDKDEKSPKKGQPIRADSHGGQFVRQDAVTVNDSDISLQEITKKSEAMERQKSV